MNKLTYGLLSVVIIFFFNINASISQEVEVLKDIFAGPVGSSASFFTPGPDGYTYFVATRTGAVNGLWRSDGTEAGTTLVVDISDGSTNSPNISLSAPFYANDKLYFWSGGSRFLYVSDGTEAGTEVILTFDSQNGENDGSVVNFIETSAGVFFHNDFDVWKTDGTAAGTQKTYFNPTKIGGLASVNDEIYFVLQASGGYELYKADANFGNVQFERRISDAGTSARMYAQNGKIVTNAVQINNSPQGVYQIAGFADITGLFDYDDTFFPTGGLRLNFGLINDDLYFLGEDANDVWGFYKNDGNNVTLVEDAIGLGNTAFEFRNIFDYNGNVYFIASTKFSSQQPISFKILKYNGSQLETLVDEPFRVIQDQIIRGDDFFYYFSGNENLDLELKRFNLNTDVVEKIVDVNANEVLGFSGIRESYVESSNIFIQRSNGPFRNGSEPFIIRTLPAGPCEIEANVAFISCDDNNTPVDGDDLYSVRLRVSGKNTGLNGWTLTSAQNNSTGFYGQFMQTQLANIPVSPNPYLINISDNDNPTCQMTLEIPANENCSFDTDFLDLAIEDYQGPTTLEEGSSLGFTITARNLGNLSAGTTPVTAKWTTQPDPNFPANNTSFYYSFIGYQSHNNIEINLNDPINAAPGQYYLNVRIGYFNNPAVEPNFDNNTLVIPILITDPNSGPCQTDTENPVFTDCPQDINILNATFPRTVFWNPPLATDNCGAVTITASHNPVEVLPVGNTTVSYIATDQAGNTAQCSFNVFIGNANPDLRIEEIQLGATDAGIITANMDVKQGEEIFITDHLITAYDPSGPNDYQSRLELRLSTDPNFSADDILIFTKDIPFQSDGPDWIGTLSNGTFNPGAIIPENQLPGEYWLVSRVDANTPLTEWSDFNNERNLKINVVESGGNPTGTADLELKLNLTPSAPGIYANVDYSLTVTNTGDQAAENIVIMTGVCGSPVYGFTGENDLVYSNSGSATKGDWNNVTQFWTVPSLAPGESGELSLQLFTLTESAKEVWAIVRAADGNDPDSSPTDVLFNTDGTLTCWSTQTLEDDEVFGIINGGSSPIEEPDFTLTNGVLLLPNPVAPGENFRATAVLRNETDVEVITPFTVSIYLSTDNQVDTDDILITEKNYASYPADGQQQVFTPGDNWFNIPENIADGAYQIIIEADVNDMVEETNENNNQLRFSINVQQSQLPDLKVSDLNVASAGGAPGEVVNFTFDLANLGMNVAAGDFDVVAFLTTQSSGSGVTYNEVGRLTTGNIGNGTRQDVLGAITVPNNFPPGDHYLNIYVDPENNIEESNELNNEAFSVDFQVGGLVSDLPDLYVMNAFVFGGYDELETNFEYDLRYYPYNEYNFNAPSSRFNIYLSADQFIDASDLLLAQQSIGVFGPNSGTSRTERFTIPDNQAPGEYFILIKSDGDEEVVESDENNNVFALPISVVEEPCTCPPTNDPVCGSDGNTYANACEAECAGILDYVTGTCPTGGGVDIEIEASVSNMNPEQYSNFTYTITAKNTGDQTGNNLNILVGLCDVTNIRFTGDNGIVYTTTGAVSGGTWNYLSQNWTIESLAPGESMELTMELFTLTEDAKSLQAFLLGMDEADIDSEYGNHPVVNGIKQCKDEEDDEVLIELNNGGGSGNDPADFTGANLIIDDQVITAGGMLNFTVDYRNLGGSESGDFTIASYLSNDQILDAADKEVELILAPLPMAGQSFSQVSFEIKTSNLTTPGNKYLILRLDGLDAFLESNENNNVILSSNTVLLEEQGGENVDCEALSIFPWENWISKVSVNGQSNASGKSQYSDFSNPLFQFSIAPNAVNQLAVEATWSYFTYEQRFAIFIDLNRDNIYQPQENIAGALAPPAPGSGVKKTFTTNWFATNLIDAQPGITFMRVIMDRDLDTLIPCGQFTSGEVEDYQIEITNSMVQPILRSVDFTGGIYPNPALDLLHIYLGDWQENTCQIRMVDALGREVKRDQLEVAEHKTWDLGAFDSGIYFLFFEMDGKAPQMEKLIIEKGR